MEKLRHTMTRTDFINSIVKRNSNYLEIGIRNGENFFNIKSKNKIGVDPNFFSLNDFLSSHSLKLTIGIIRSITKPAIISMIMKLVYFIIAIKLM